MDNEPTLEAAPEEKLSFEQPPPGEEQPVEEKPVRLGTRVVGVQLRDDSSIYDYDAGELDLKRGDLVILGTEDGPAMGLVCTEPRRYPADAPVRPTGRVERLAGEDEKARYLEIKRSEQEIFQYCYEKVKEKGLEMSLICAEQRMDRSKTTIYFTAEGRIDFRELVKDLVSRFRTRIEMRQVGVRHQAKMVGGLGVCGRPLCCSSFLKNFDPVTIKMAKEQNLSLNPTKISGMCCRLMCCLSFENEYYHEVRKDFPKVGKKISTKKGEGKVVRQNVLRKTITLQLESGDEIEIKQDELLQ
jgi:cell fate regulator YaaT (PSP1 superfamily)